jgi:hypothetical protein
MTNFEFYLARRKAELPAFVRVLKAMPQAGLGYRPEPKSRTAAEIAWLMAAEEEALVALLDTGTVEWKDTPPPAQATDIVAAFEKSAAAADERLARLQPAAWEKTRALHGGRQRRVGRHHGPDAVGVPLRRHPPPRAAQHVSAADGRQGAVDLRALGRRQRAVARGQRD